MRLGIGAVLLAALFLTAAVPPSIDRRSLARDLATLADDALAGRAPGTPGAEAAVAYIVRRFAEVGLTPGAGAARWRQPVSVGGVASANVVGRLGGRSRPDEAVVVTAHWDHLGLCGPGWARDRICNGAVDNASGVALMTAVAGALAAGPRPARTVLFVATTGEEAGLIGARVFVASPPLPRGNIVAAINLDTVAVAPAGAPVGIVGRGLTRLDPIVDAEARRLRRAVDRGARANRFVGRQDGAAFLAVGIPAIMVGGGFGDTAPLERFLAGRYHRADDDLVHLPPLDGAIEDGTLLVAVIRAFADPRRLPRRRAGKRRPAIL